MRRLAKAVAGGLLVAALVPFALAAWLALFDPARVAPGRFVPLGEMPSRLVQGVILSEDARFCLHYGIDMRQLKIAVRDALDGKAPRGASTITMQVAKNVFLWPERSYLRKTLEVPLALALDLVLSKDRILEVYLNVAQFGPRAFGAEAGAQAHFGRDLARLSEREAFALATTLPAPATRDPAAPSRHHERLIANVARALEEAPWVFGCLPPAFRP